MVTRVKTIPARDELSPKTKDFLLARHKFDHEKKTWFNKATGNESSEQIKLIFLDKIPFSERIKHD